MPNYLKYSTSTQSQALKIGNYWIGTGEIKKGPTSVTDYWNGIAPPSGGYTIYGNKASGGPAIHVAANDTELISLTNIIGKQSFTSVTQSLSWFITQSDKMVFNREYEPIVTNGLVLNLDAGFAPSYPITGTTWYDLSGYDNNGTLLNGPIYSSDNGGSITVDGVNDRISISSSSTLNFLGTLSYSIEVWGNLQSIQDGARMMVSREDSIGVGRDGYNIILTNMTSSTVSFSAERFASNVQNEAKVSLLTSSVLNTWAHYVATYDGQFYRLFFNGALVATSSLITSNITNTTSTVSIGNRGAGLGNFINMKMAVFRIYNRGLSQEEVIQNYNANRSRFGLPGPPTNISTPVVTGINIVSRTLTTTNGSWTETPSITYQWQRSTNGGSSFTNISGAISSSYVLQSVDSSFIVRCQVTATNIYGSLTSVSNSTTILNTILDTYSTSQAITYHLSLERGARYGQPIINVRRTSDNASQDFTNTTSGEIDVAAIQTFVGNPNRIVRSQDMATFGTFSVSLPWSTTDGTTSIIGTNSVAPDGTNTATTWRLGGQYSVLQQSWQGGSSAGLLNPDTSSTWCMSAYVKKVNRNEISLQTSVNENIYTFNYDTPAIGPTGSGFETLSNGWFRIWIRITGSQVVNGLRFQGGNTSTGGDEHLVWGVQINPGATPSIYARTITGIGGAGQITTWYDQSTQGFNATQNTALLQDFIAIDGIVATSSRNEPVAKRFQQASPLVRQGVYVINNTAINVPAFTMSSATIYRKFLQPLTDTGNRSVLNSYWYLHHSAAVGHRDPPIYNSSISLVRGQNVCYVWNKQTTGLEPGITASANVLYRQHTGLTGFGGLTAGTIKTNLLTINVGVNRFADEFFNTFNTEDFRGQLVYTTSHDQATMEAISLII